MTPLSDSETRGCRGPAPCPEAIVDDSFCGDCQKWLSEHEVCDGCGHYVCDCICEFLRTEWPTHPMNPDRRRCDQCGRVGTRGFVTIPSSHEGPTDGVESFTVCGAGPACRKRRKEAAYPDD